MSRGTPGRLTFFLVVLCSMYLLSRCSVLFETPVDMTYGSINAPTVFQDSTESITDCARMCYEMSDCVNFHFDKEIKICKISNAVISESVGEVYGLIPSWAKGCPSSLNYKIYRNGDITLCLRIGTTLVNQQAAVDSCSSDGAHMCLLEDEKMRLFIGSILTKHGIDVARIDGKDVLGDNVFKNYKGEVMTYLPFEPPDPATDSQDCLATVAIYQFRIRDGFCHELANYICQID